MTFITLQIPMQAYIKMMSNILQAFQTFDRRDFIPPGSKDLAYLDTPLPIGYGQTISQPATVRIMLKWLTPKEGDKVLDVGSGSGWTSAILSDIVGPKGKVCAVELIPELVRQGRINCAKYNLKNIHFFQASSEYGLPGHAPFDRILVSASANKLPKKLLSQLKIGGKLVIPVKYDILEITKINDEEFDTVTHPGFIFVPLVKHRV